MPIKSSTHPKNAMTPAPRRGRAPDGASSPSKNLSQQFMRAHELAQYFGITAMGLWRWRTNPELDFPQPTVINGTSYWRVADIESWAAKDHGADKSRKVRGGHAK